MLEREQWSGVPSGLQEGSHAKKAVLYNRDAQATAALWGAFPFYSIMHASRKVPQKRKT